jgi:uncharacterized membrane protein
MSSTEPNSTRTPVVSDEQLVLIVYLLYFAAYIFGITALIGVIIAHIRFQDATLLLRSGVHGCTGTHLRQRACV